MNSFPHKYTNMNSFPHKCTNMNSFPHKYTNMNSFPHKCTNMNSFPYLRACSRHISFVFRVVVEVGTERNGVGTRVCLEGRMVGVLWSKTNTL